MATLISVIGTAVTILAFALSEIPDPPNKAQVTYIIANDGATGPETPGQYSEGVGGDLPDVRHFDETAEFLGANYDGSDCPEGYTTCNTDVNTQEAVTCTLFSGNNDAICIAWTGLEWAGGQKKYGFHPGNWAHACDQVGDQGGYWFYSGQQVPGISSEEDVFCAWVDKDGDIPTTGFSVHWPEFDGDNSPDQSLDYYCNNNPPVEFRTDSDPSTIAYWVQRHNVNARAVGGHWESSQNATIMKRFEKDPTIIKSHFAKHAATELWDRTRKAAGQSFVSFAE